MIPYVIFLTAVAVAYGLITGWAGYEIGYKRRGRDQDRHRHRKGDPQETVLLELPTAGRLPIDPGPETEQWTWFGGAQVDPAPGSAEYELLTRAADRCPCLNTSMEACKASSCARLSTDETPSDFTRRMTREVDAMIAAWDAQGNYDRHTIQAGE